MRSSGSMKVSTVKRHIIYKNGRVFAVIAKLHLVPTLSLKTGRE